MILPECKGCGACCAYGRDWVPVSKADQERVPPEFYQPSDPQLDWEDVPRPDFVMKTTPETNPLLRVINDPAAGGQRCLALSGKVGEGAYCTLYEPDRRPTVCKTFERGSPECCWILGWYGLGRPWP